MGLRCWLLIYTFYSLKLREALPLDVWMHNWLPTNSPAGMHPKTCQYKTFGARTKLHPVAIITHNGLPIPHECVVSAAVNVSEVDRIFTELFLSVSNGQRFLHEWCENFASSAIQILELKKLIPFNLTLFMFKGKWNCFAISPTKSGTDIICKRQPRWQLKLLPAQMYF